MNVKRTNKPTRLDLLAKLCKAGCVVREKEQLNLSKKELSELTLYVENANAALENFRQKEFDNATNLST